MLQVEDAEFVGPKALLFLQLLIAFITRSVVNVRNISNGFLLVSLVTTLVSLEEVRLPSFEVMNCWLNLVASCLDDENEIPLKVIASFSASRFALPSIPLIVLHSLVTSVFWSMVSTKSLHFSVCAHRCGSGWFYSILAVQVRWGLFYRGCCLPTPMALASGGSPMFPLVVHQPASPSIWPAVQSLRRGLSTNPGATMWCVCGCS